MGDGPRRSAVVNAADEYRVPQFILFGQWGLETTWGENVKTSSAGAMGDFQFTAATKPAPNGGTVRYPMTNTPDGLEFQAQAIAAAGYDAYLYDANNHDWNVALQKYSGGAYGLDSVTAMFKTRMNWLPTSVTVQYEAWLASGVVNVGSQQVVTVLSPAHGDYTSWADLVKSAGQHANKRASNLRYLAARNRGALDRGIRFLPGPGKATVAPGIHLHVPAPKFPTLTRPKQLYVGTTAPGPARTGDYVNPVPGWTPTRIDQGVDGTLTWRGFRAPGRSRIIDAVYSDPGWAGGGYVTGRLLDGDHAGAVWFVAEGVAPSAGISNGVIVDVGARITTNRPNPYNGIVGNIECGWADPNDTLRPLAQALPGYSGDQSVQGITAGSDWNEWISSLGAPAGHRDPGAPAPDPSLLRGINL